MTMKEEPNPNWAQLPLFDRSKWKTVRFGDVVELVSDTVRDARKEGIDRYIGMEHLEPGSLHISTWGELADGITFTKRCRVGQVLFGKRRAYQRKVAIAEFDAVVSGDIYVFQAKADRLDPKLLPFLCMSERFFQFAVETSAGSLSPRTNWSHLKDFEFALPPLDQQRRIAELLWAVDEVNEQYTAVETSVLNSIETSRAAHTVGSDQSVAVKLQDACTDIVDCPHTTPHFIEAGVLVVRNFNIRAGALDLQTRFFTSEDEWKDRTKRLTPEEGDILFSREAPVGEACIVPSNTKLSLGQRTMLLRCDPQIALPEFLLQVLYSKEVQRTMQNLASGTTVAHLNVKDVRELEVLLPPLFEQRKAMEEINVLSNALSHVRSSLASTRLMRDAMLAATFDSN